MASCFRSLVAQAWFMTRALPKSSSMVKVLSHTAVQFLQPMQVNSAPTAATVSVHSSSRCRPETPPFDSMGAEVGCSSQAD